MSTALPHHPEILYTGVTLSNGMACPACGGPVTLEVGSDHPLSTSLPDANLAADEDKLFYLYRDSSLRKIGDKTIIVRYDTDS